MRSALHRLLTDGVLCIFDQFSDQLNATAFVLSLTLTIAFLTNAVCNLDKYSLHFGDIRFALVTVIDHREFSNNLGRLLKLNSFYCVNKPLKPLSSTTVVLSSGTGNGQSLAPHITLAKICASEQRAD